MPGCRVIVTGGGGFLGRYLIHTLLRRPLLNNQAVKSIAILDAGKDLEAQCDTEINVFPERVPNQSKVKIEKWTGDINDRALVTECLRGDKDSNDQPSIVAVFHLASVMSAAGEQNFDRCLKVNVDGTRTLLDACRDVTTATAGQYPPVRFIFPSSIAAFGAQREVDDGTRLLPITTYGTSKAVAELLINDYTRKGMVDGRTGRLPTVLVRPGTNNMAATVCYSGLVRELLQGNPFTIPVDPKHPHPVCSADTIAKGLIALAEAPTDALGHDRAVNFPSISITMDDLLFHTQHIAHARGIPLGESKVKEDDAINRIIKSMPSMMKATRAKEVVGMKGDASVEAILQQYVDQFLHDEMDFPSLASR